MPQSQRPTRKSQAQNSALETIVSDLESANGLFKAQRWDEAAEAVPGL